VISPQQIGNYLKI